MSTPLTFNGSFTRNRSAKGMKLRVSANQRYFVDQEGNPFFYLADTAWSIFKQLSREAADIYLENRAKKGFTVIQAYVLRGLKVQNIYGEVPLIGKDPTKLNDNYFKHVDYIIDKAEELGIFFCLVIAYGQHVRAKVKPGENFTENEAIFNEENAYEYARCLTHRYKNKPIIWNLGGDREPIGDEHIFRAMANGLRSECGSDQLISFHGPGPHTYDAVIRHTSSSWWFHNDPWLDFNTIQSGHGWMIPNYRDVTIDYQKVPVKPTLDMENKYEDFLVPHDHEIDPDIIAQKKPCRRLSAHQIREGAYWQILSGAAGHGYGCCGVWEFKGEHIAKDYSEPQDHWSGRVNWQEAMELPGAFSMAYMRTFFEKHPWYKLVPDQSLIISGQGTTPEDHIVAAIANDKSFLIAYSPFGNTFGIATGTLAAQKIKAQWFNPADGKYTQIGVFDKKEKQEFAAPTSGMDNDWVLVLEDVNAGLEN